MNCLESRRVVDTVHIDDSMDDDDYNFNEMDIISI